MKSVRQVAATKSVTPAPTKATAPPPAAQTPAKKAAAKKAPAKITTARKATASPKSPQGKSELSAAELADLRRSLEAELRELEGEYARSMIELNDLQTTNTDGAGDDQADAGSKTFEREQEQSIAANRHDLIIQTQRAISRIDAGTYGLCENCGNPIPKARLQALPMATLDAACKAREERR